MPWRRSCLPIQIEQFGSLGHLFPHQYSRRMRTDTRYRLTLDSRVLRHHENRAFRGQQRLYSKEAVDFLVNWLVVERKASWHNKMAVRPTERIRSTKAHVPARAGDLAWTSVSTPWNSVRDVMQPFPDIFYTLGSSIAPAKWC